MKLTFIITDNWASFNEAMMGCTITDKRRTVTIDLTPEQSESLKLRKVGISAGKDVYEEITCVFIEKE